MRLSWMAHILRSEGLKVIEMNGWRGRETRPGYDPKVIVCHDTVTPITMSNRRVSELLRDGRPDLNGPLSQLGLQRDGIYVCVADGRCNHNGFGAYGNDSIGIEAYNNGVDEPWTKPQMNAYIRGVAAICRKMRWNATKVLAHKETDPKRKIDPNFDMHKFRLNVKAQLAEGKNNMASTPFTQHLCRDTRNGKLYRVSADAVTKIWINAEAYAFDRLVLPDNLEDEIVCDGVNGWAWLDSIDTVLAP